MVLPPKFCSLSLNALYRRRRRRKSSTTVQLESDTKIVPPKESGFLFAWRSIASVQLNGASAKFVSRFFPSQISHNRLAALDYAPPKRQRTCLSNLFCIAAALTHKHLICIPQLSLIDNETVRSRSHHQMHRGTETRTHTSHKNTNRLNERATCAFSPTDRSGVRFQVSGGRDRWITTLCVWVNLYQRAFYISRSRLAETCLIKLRGGGEERWWGWSVCGCKWGRCEIVN